jgi:hypothetical protein
MGRKRKLIRRMNCRGLPLGVDVIALVAIIRIMHCVVLIVVLSPVSTWWLYCVVCRVGRDIDSSCSLVCMSVCNLVEGIQSRISSLGLFKGTVPLLRLY